MPDNSLESSPRARLHTAILVLLFLGLALALAGNVYQFIKTDKMSGELASMRHNLQAQITRLSDATSGAFDVTEQRFLEGKKLQDSAAAALSDARAELQRSNAGMVEHLEERNQELAKANRDLASQLAALKQDTGANIQKTNSALQATTAKLDATSARLDRISAAIDANRADLKRVASDLAAMRAPVAIAPKRRPLFHDSDDHNRIAFDLLTTKVPTRVGEIQIAILSADPKKNGYTMDLYTDDKVARDSSHMVNEAVEFYVSGHAQPFQLVVTEVRKDEVLGYVSESKATSKAEAAATVHGAGATGRP
ncbi:MAG TPA: hypothetical protein VKG79_16510 [Bryobacteraceae bacterium]|nr:hypothetical protein [Bryobacteraceae bacterium]